MIVSNRLARPFPLPLRAIGLLLPLLLIGTASAQESPLETPEQVAQAALPAFTEEREAAALVFVRTHRPELIAVLEELKSSRRDEYERAVREFFRTSETLAAARQRGEDYYRIALETWRTEMMIHLLIARLAKHPDQESQIAEPLTKLVEAKVQLQIHHVQLQLRHGEQQLNQLRQQLQQLEARREELVRQAVETTLQHVREHRRRAEASQANANGEKDK